MGMGTGVGIQGGYTGWVIGRAIPGTQPPWKAEPMTAKRAPEDSLQGSLEWVVMGAAPARLQVPPTPGPLGLPGPASLYLDPPRLLANSGEIPVNLL